MGNLYGSTEGGGSYGIGTIYKLSSTGQEIILVNFTGLNGNGPSGLIRDSTGNFYGTTATGGTGFCEGGCGVIFKIDSSGNQTVLYDFAGGSDGADPLASLVLDSAGNLYGTSFAGGANGYGNVFKLDPNNNFTVLYNSTGRADGANSHSELILDRQNNLYGTTPSGGSNACSGGCGVIFRVAPNGSETVLHTFKAGNPLDGAVPWAGLVANSGAVYGATYQGGTNNQGIVFKLAVPTPFQ